MTLRTVCSKTALCTLLLAPACQPGGEVQASGLSIEVLATGEGAEAEPGQYVAIHYEAWKLGGSRFDSSRSRGEAFVFQLGGERVLPGVDDGIAGMRRGGKRRLIVPPQLAYGDIGKGVIRPGDALIYEIELVDLFTHTESGLAYRVVEPGEGETARTGQIVILEFEGKLLASGRQFCSSKRNGRDLSLPVGKGRALPGFEEAFPIMRLGGRYQLVLPPDLAYGALGSPPHIPPATDLFYDLRVKGLRQASQ